MLKIMSAAQLAAKLEEISRAGRNEFIRVICECDDWEMTVALLDTMRLTSLDTIGLITDLVALRSTGASDGAHQAWHERAKDHMQRIVDGIELPKC
jgi:hypothetical protein